MRVNWLEAHEVKLRTGAAVLSLLNALALLLWFLPDALPPSHTDGVWVALAEDIAVGEHYRPIFEGGLYGGTRYMPLFLWLHGGAIALGADPIQAGFVLSLASAVLIGLGVYAFLRASGQEPSAAAGWATILLASIQLQLLLLGTRGDLLAIALTVWGLVLFQRSQRHTDSRRWPALALAALFFAGAMSTKFSAIAGWIAAALVLRKRGQRQEALVLLGTVGALFSIVIGVAWLLSRGRIVESFVACASGGGAPSGLLLRAPWVFLSNLIQDPVLLCLLLGALWGSFKGSGRLPGLTFNYLFASLATLWVVLASPGTAGNHLLELLVAAGSVLGSVQAPRLRAGISLVVATMVLLSWLPGTSSVRGDLQPVGRITRTAVARIGRQLEPGPVLSEHPAIPGLLNQRATVLDPFAVRLVGRSRPRVQLDLCERLARAEFSAVILVDVSGAPEEELETRVLERTMQGDRPFYEDRHFGPGFREALRRSYRLSRVERPLLVFVPKR